MDIQPTKGVNTSEFGLVIIKIAVGMLVSSGVIAQAHQNDVTSSVETIVGGIIMLAPALSYILGRTWLKAKVAHPGPTSTVSVNPTTVVTP